MWGSPVKTLLSKLCDDHGHATLLNGKSKRPSPSWTGGADEGRRLLPPTQSALPPRQSSRKRSQRGEARKFSTAGGLLTSTLHG